MKFAPPLWLASRSPRRKQLLEQAKLEVRVRAAEIDDAKLCNPGVPAEHWVMAMAHLKARSVADVLRELPGCHGTILGADTVCVVEGEILGQPRDCADARRMIVSMRGRWHQTLTGVCLLDLRSLRRVVWFDRSDVHIGQISNGQIDDYIARGQWRGKAGGYNLIERIDAGWPIEVRGDPATVMGLPMRRLLPILKQETK